MTEEFDAFLRVGRGTTGEPQPPPASMGRLVSLRTVLSALRRRRWAWIGVAMAGMVIGSGFHVVVPRHYSATVTLYLAYPEGSDATTGMSNDVALAATATVAQRADRILGEDLSPASLLGSSPAVAQSSNVLVLTIDGPTNDEALMRANAVAAALLAVRAAEYSNQTDSMINALQAEVSRLESQIGALSSSIATGGPSDSSLASERSQDAAEVVNLVQEEQAAQVDLLGVSSSSKVLTPATTTSTSTKRLIARDGISGLIAGLALGVGWIGIGAVCSDRLRRREDIAAILGAPVELSVVGMPRSRRWTGWWGRWRPPSPAVKRAVRHLRGALDNGQRPAILLVVAADDLEGPATILAHLVGELVADGKEVLVADRSARHCLEAKLATMSNAMGGDERRLVTLVSELGQHRQTADTDVCIAFSDVDPATGAPDLAGCSTEAVVMVTAGRSTATRLNTVYELLHAGGVNVSSVVLLGADAADESVGLPDPSFPTLGGPLSVGIPALRQR